MLKSTSFNLLFVEHNLYDNRNENKENTFFMKVSKHPTLQLGKDAQDTIVVERKK